MSITALTLALNEDEALPRLNASVAGVCDTHLIFDTGSEQLPRCGTWPTNTVVRELGWENFGQARTEAASWVGAEWFLFLDADMTIEAHPGLRDWLLMGHATADAYMVDVVDGDLRYKLPLLLRGGCGWRWVGETHEYLDTTGHVVAQQLNGLTVHHHADGANRDEKHQRDIELLAPRAAAGDPRATYYTAQAYWCLRFFREAAVLYLQRSRMGAFEEERWHAGYMYGRCMLEVEPEEGARALVRSHLERPSRAEPLWALSEWARANRPFEPPFEDVLFIEPPAYPSSESPCAKSHI